MDAANCDLACNLVGRTYIQQGAQVKACSVGGVY